MLLFKVVLCVCKAPGQKPEKKVTHNCQQENKSGAGGNQVFSSARHHLWTTSDNSSSMWKRSEVVECAYKCMHQSHVQKEEARA